jgi:hypothetical protein
MNDDEDRGLTADLAALRGALREVRASQADEARLIAALRVRRVVAEPAAAATAAHAARVPARSARRGRAPFALAATAALAAVTAMLALRVEQAGGPEVPAAAVLPDASEGSPASASAASEDFGAFQPLAFSPGLSASQSYSVVRVRIPLAALTPGFAAPPDMAIEADLLVGEDGLASGIRFNRADTLFVSTASSEIGERR